MGDDLGGLRLPAGCDRRQRFLKRARYSRLLSAVLDRPQLIGVGIDRETALQVVRPDGRWEVLGKSYVKVIDARGATHDRQTSPARQHPAAPAAGQRVRSKRTRITLPRTAEGQRRAQPRLSGPAPATLATPQQSIIRALWTSAGPQG